MIAILFLTTLLLAFAGSAILTRLAGKKLIEHSVFDLPNERSMHAAPVPRGGGLAVLGIVAGGLVLILPFSFPQALFLLGGLSLAGYVSWYDDRHGLDIGTRLCAHILAAGLGSLAFGTHFLVFQGLLPFWFDRFLMILGWAWFMNLYNFMDGIDGMTGAQGFSHALGAFLVLVLARQFDLLDMTLTALVAGGCGGFLLYNWHPAKIFLGDVGSIPLGFLTGFLFLKLAVLGHPVAALLLPLYYLADSGLTIAKRLLAREKIWKPHRSHFYQRAAAGTGRHDTVVFWVLATNAALAVFAALSLGRPWEGLACGVITVALLLWKMHKSAKETS